MGSEHTDVLRTGKISCCVLEQLPKFKVLHQKPLVLMPTRTFPGTYGIELLWWHSVTNYFGDPHGVQTYGYIDKWEDFPVAFERNCQNRSVTPKLLTRMGTRIC